MKIQFIDVKSNKERKKNILYHFKMDPFDFEGDKINVVSETNDRRYIQHMKMILLQ